MQPPPGSSAVPSFDAKAYERLLDQVPAPMWLSAFDGRALWVNRAWLEYAGMSLPAALAMPWTSFVHPDDLTLLASVGGEAIERREPFEVAIRVRRHDGQWRWALNSGRPYLDEHGEAVGYVGTLVDITEQRQSKARLQAVLDHLGHPAFLHTPDGTYLFVNREWYRLFAPGERDIEGKHASDFFPEDVVRRIRESNDATMRRGGRMQYQLTLPTVFGPREYLVTKFPLTDPVGGIEAIAGMATDLTEVHEREAHTRALERRLDEARHLESLAVLAGGLAHDFNNLLQSVVGNAGLLSMELPEGSRLRAYVDPIAHAAGRAAELTRQMLDYAGLTPLGHERIHPSELAAGWESEVRSELPPGVTLRMHCEPGVPVVAGDEARLRQVLNAFLKNALEALPGRAGRIEVRVYPRAAAEPPRALPGRAPLPPGDYACFEVRDDGEGMDESRLRRVFDPFFSTRFPGRGLGLPAALGIAMAHGGTIEVDSAPGKGASFRLLVPACQPSRSASRNAAP